MKNTIKSSTVKFQYVVGEGSDIEKVDLSEGFLCIAGSAIGEFQYTAGKNVEVFINHKTNEIYITSDADHKMGVEAPRGSSPILIIRDTKVVSAVLRMPGAVVSVCIPNI